MKEMTCPKCSNARANPVHADSSFQTGDFFVCFHCDCELRLQAGRLRECDFEDSLEITPRELSKMGALLKGLKGLAARR